MLLKTKFFIISVIYFEGNSKIKLVFDDKLTQVIRDIVWIELFMLAVCFYLKRNQLIFFLWPFCLSICNDFLFIHFSRIIIFISPNIDHLSSGNILPCVRPCASSLHHYIIIRSNKFNTELKICLKRREDFTSVSSYKKILKICKWPCRAG